MHSNFTEKVPTTTQPAEAGADSPGEQFPAPARSDGVRSRRSRRRWILGAVAGLAAVALGLGLWLTSPAALAQTGTAQCADVPTTSALDQDATEDVRAGVCATIAGLTQAWAAHDATAYGAGFTENATYTTFAGTYYTGRHDITDSHAALFDGVLEGTRLTDAYLGLQVLTDDVAILTTRGDRYEGDDPGALTKVQTYTLVRQEDVWRVAAFQNTARSEAMERIQFIWMPHTRPAAER